MSHDHLLSQLKSLVSESRNPRSMDIDLMETADVLQLMNSEDRIVPDAVEKTLPAIAEAVDAIVAAFRAGGRLVYLGAGTSGRLGILDASECPPTFSVPDDMVVGLIAGGPTALVRAVEGAEDDPDEGRGDLEKIGLRDRDIVVGIAVSGRTPYVTGGLDYAKSVGARTIGLSCNPGSPVATLADIAISPVVGPEVITGSTRLKSGTAQKLVLNMLSTASMIRIGKTYQNLMVDVTVSNQKLHARAIRIVMEATGCPIETAKDHLAASNNNVKLAILTILTGLSVGDASNSLSEAGGFLRRAITTTRQQAAQR